VRPRVIREIIYSKLDDLSDRLCGQGHDAPENGDARGLYAQPICDADTKPTPSRETNDLDDLEEPPSHACARGNKGSQTLREDFSRAEWHIAEKFPYRKQEAHGLPGTRQIGQSARISTVNTCRRRPAHRTARGRLRGKQGHTQHSFLAGERSHLKARR
jgi:hypothetical protein